MSFQCKIVRGQFSRDQIIFGLDKFILDRLRDYFSGNPDRSNGNK